MSALHIRMLLLIHVVLVIVRFSTSITFVPRSRLLELRLPDRDRYPTARGRYHRDVTVVNQQQKHLKNDGCKLGQDPFLLGSAIFFWEGQAVKLKGIITPIRWPKWRTWSIIGSLKTWNRPFFVAFWHSQSHWIQFFIRNSTRIPLRCLPVDTKKFATRDLAETFLKPTNDSEQNLLQCDQNRWLLNIYKELLCKTKPEGIWNAHQLASTG